MSNKEKTKDTLLEAGRRIFSEKGYTASGIEAVLQAAGVPKGSFYYYFQSKEDFGLQVLDSFAHSFEAKMDLCLNDEGRSPLERVRCLFGGIVENIETQQCRKGCLVGRLSQEMADQSEVFRARVEEIFEGWVSRLAEGLRRAQEAGEIPAHLDAHQLAEFWLNSWQGAVLRAKTIRSIAPLRTFLDMMFGYILQA